MGAAARAGMRAAARRGLNLARGDMVALGRKRRAAPGR